MSQTVTTSTKKKILVQLDCDVLPSTFDAVVAIDSGVEHLLQYGSIHAENVTGLVHGCMFTRGVDDLKQTAIFVGGSNVAATEAIAARIRKTFFGPMRVSVMVDGNGSNTTAGAAVVTVHRHLDLSQSTVAVLAATGPVGTIASKLLARNAKEVRLFSRDKSKAEQVAATLAAATSGTSPSARVTCHSSAQTESLMAGLHGCHAIIACGAAGIQLLAINQWKELADLKLLIDLNAVPPAGIEGVEAFDHEKVREGKLCFGPIGVGGLKMKMHKAAIRTLFESNSAFLDSFEIFDIGLKLN
jgi:hypothetical protein